MEAEEVKCGRVLSRSDPRKSLKEAIRAEKDGFDSVWMADHIMTIAKNPRQAPCADAWTTLALIASETKEVKIGTSVTDPHRRHPAVLAQTVTNLDIISNGRIILGIGAGEAMNLNPYGIVWNKPVSRMEEAIDIIKKLWTEVSVDYEGKFYTLKKASLPLKNIQKPHPPIWIAANSPRTRKILGETGHGWIPVKKSPELYKKDLEEIRTWARRAERDAEEIEPGLYVQGYVSQDYNEARKAAEMDGKIGLLVRPGWLRRLGYKAPTDKYDLSRLVVTKESVKALLEQAKEIPFEAVERYFIFGTPDDCIKEIERYVEAGAKHFILSLHEEKEYRLYAKKILPYFQ